MKIRMVGVALAVVSVHCFIQSSGNMKSIDPIVERQALEAIVRKAGDVALSYFNTVLDIEEKPNEQGFVTRADKATENYLMDALTKLLPGSCFVAEESGESGGHTQYCWVIDPIDGTTNFIWGIPTFAVSVALARDGVPFIGVVYLPALDELFYAQEGVGAFMNGKPIRVSQKDNLAKGVLGIDLSHRGRRDPKYLKLFSDAMKAAYTVRHFGSAVTDLAFVACGRLGGVILADLSWWDVAAGMVLVQQAGGLVTEFDGSPVRQGYKTCIAANPGVHRDLYAVVQNSAL